MKRLSAFVAMAAFAAPFSGASPASAANTTTVFGDADCSAHVDAPDMLSVLEWTSDIKASPCILAGDVNCDGKIDVRDALAIGLSVAGVTHPTGGCDAIGDAMPPQGLVIGDPQDFELVGKDGAGQGDGNYRVGDGVAGDTSGNLGRRTVLGFDIPGVQGAISSAKLRITVEETRLNQDPTDGTNFDSVPPFTNPGLGDIEVINIGEDMLPGHAEAAYGAPSIGNDPGVLVPAGVEAERLVTIDVEAALEQAVSARKHYVVFRLQAATETDDDSLNDVMFFCTSDWKKVAQRPQLEYTAGP